MNPTPWLSVVLPAHNEEGNLSRQVEEVREYLVGAGVSFEIVVVDDGSTDDTAAVAAALAAIHSELRIVTHERNRGYGGALRSGFAAARGEWILLLDADCQFAIADLGRFLERTEEADFVIGYRKDRKDHVTRLWLAGLGNALARFIFRLKVRDIDCAFKLMRASFLRAFPLVSHGGFISTEVLVHASQAGCRIVEIPVRHFPRQEGQPSGASPRVIGRMVKEFLAFKFRALEAPIIAEGMAETEEL